MEEIKKDFEEKKKELKDWLYGTVYKGYDLEELAETVQQDVDDFFTEEWFNSVINLAVSKERESIVELLEKTKLPVNSETNRSTGDGDKRTSGTYSKNSNRYR